MFDELDDPGSEMNQFWDKEVDWERLDDKKYGALNLQAFTLCGFKLADSTESTNLSKASGFACNAKKYRKMRNE